MKRLTTFAAALILASSTAALADPPPQNHHHWRNTNYPSHYVLYDYASRQWLETINCQVMYRFQLVRNELNAIELHDPTRNMTIRLTYEGMFLKPNGEAQYSFYQNGTFDRRERFSHYDNGAYTGNVVKGHACQWREYFSGQSQPAFTFVGVSANGGAVELYDRSRDMWVKLEADKMHLRTGSAPYGFFKWGRWD